jgi:hypothetical protein
MVLQSIGTVCEREIKNSRRFSGTKPEGRRPHAIPRHKLKDNAEIDLKGTD